MRRKGREQVENGMNQSLHSPGQHAGRRESLSGAGFDRLLRVGAPTAAATAAVDPACAGCCFGRRWLASEAEAVVVSLPLPCRCRSLVTRSKSPKLAKQNRPQIHNKKRKIKQNQNKTKMGEREEA